MNLRPATLDEYIGQDHIKRPLLTEIEAVKQKGEPLDHILLAGPAGLGKTTLAQVIANEMKSACRIINAAKLETVAQVSKVVEEAEAFDVIFIDEIHRLPAAAEEFLYHPMEDGKIEIQEEVETEVVSPALAILADAKKIDPTWGGFPNLRTKEVEVRTVQVDLPPLTIIGATTMPGMLSKPLRDRFEIHLTLRPYSKTELAAIAKQKATMLEIEMSDEAAQNIGRRSRGVARLCVRYVKRCRNYAIANGYDAIGNIVVDETFSQLNVDELGLTPVDHKYLSVLSDGKPKGVRALASISGEDTYTIENVIEPYLAQIGFIERTRQGRVITERGLAYIST